MTRSCVIYLIDIDRKKAFGDTPGRADALAELGRNDCQLDVTCEGSDADAPANIEGVRGVLGHDKDLKDVRWLASVSCPVVWYSGNGGEHARKTAESTGRTGDHVLPWAIDRGRRAKGTIDCHKGELVELFRWLRDGRDPPAFLQPNRDLLVPLVPFGVLLDGYLALDQPPDPVEWFKPAVEAARAAPGVAVSGDQYWKDLAESRAAVRRVGERLKALDGDSGGFTKVLQEVAALGWSGPDTGEAGARMLLESARDAVRDAWTKLSSKTEDQGAPRGGDELARLVHVASVGFHVLAAGHL